MCILKSSTLFLRALVLVQIAKAEIELCDSSANQISEVQNVPKYCLLRDNVFDSRLWDYYAGYFCYRYTNQARLIKRYNLTTANVTCSGKLNVIPLAQINETFAVTYNYKILADTAYIRKSFKNDKVFNNYIKCCSEADYCCKNSMNNENIKSTQSQCPALWDAWTCFPQTKVNTTAKLPCSSQVYQSPDDVCTLESKKVCFWNQTSHLAEWIQDTDYTPCDIVPIYTRKYNFHIMFLGICIGFCVPAITIFFVFEKLRRTMRVILHRNLLMAICIRNAFTIMSKKLIILDELKIPEKSFHRMEENSAGCRFLTFLETSSINCIYACMFLDAYYLHKVIVRAFAKETRTAHVYIVLLVMTFSFSSCWAIVMAAKEAGNCWTVDVDGMHWIPDGFRIAILVVNTILLTDIIRVMVLKLKHGSTTKQTMAAFRATIFLIPLFGLHIMVTANKIVYDDSCTAENIYDYTRYSMEGLQGMVVSILYCYANNEVQSEVRNGYRKTCIYLNQRYGWNLGGDLLYDKRRATTATFVQEAYQ